VDDEMTQIIKGVDKDSEIHLLEIGSFEGMSTVWFLENVLLNVGSTITCIDPWVDYSQKSINNEQTYDWRFKDERSRFLYNISECGFKSKVTVREGFSCRMLSELIILDKKYDIVYIDGNHTPAFVLMDAVMSWNLLKNGGMMIFDDYLLKNFIDKIDPIPAIDAFLNIFSDYCELVFSGYKKAIVKKRDI